MLLLALASAGAFMDRLHYFAAAPYLKSLGIAEAQIMPIMSLGQVTEVFAMAVMLYMLNRLGFRRTIIIGLAAQVLRFGLFVSGGGIAAVMLGISCHGIGFAWGFTGLQILLDHFCETRSRAGVHFILSLATSGLATVLASAAGGLLLEGNHSFFIFWCLPAVVALISFVTAVLFLFEPETIKGS